MYKAGDKILVEFEVIEKDNGPVISTVLGPFNLPGNKRYSQTMSTIKPDMIKGHIVKPREPQVGDVMKRKALPGVRPAYRFVIEYIDPEGNWAGRYYYLNEGYAPAKTWLVKSDQGSFELANDPKGD